MNWWLVTRHLKHGMMTVRLKKDSPHHDMPGMDMSSGDPHVGHDMAAMNTKPSVATIAAMSVVSTAILAAAVVIVLMLAG
jgi:hypothetical protein